MTGILYHRPVHISSLQYCESLLNEQHIGLPANFGSGGFHTAIKITRSVDLTDYIRTMEFFAEYLNDAGLDSTAGKSTL